MTSCRVLEEIKATNLDKNKVMTLESDVSVLKREIMKLKKKVIPLMPLKIVY